MDRKIALLMCALSGVSLADIDTGTIGQSNSASNGFSNAAVASMNNTQVNMNSSAANEYGSGVKCAQATVNISPFASQSQAGSGSAQTMGIAAGITIPLGDGGTCAQMAQNLEHKQRADSGYERIKLCIEMAKNGVTIDQDADPELFQTCRHVHINGVK